MSETWTEKRKKTKSPEQKKVLIELEVLELETKMRAVNNALNTIQENVDELETKIRLAEHRKNMRYKNGD